jgi:transposase-like protein
MAKEIIRIDGLGRYDILVRIEKSIAIRAPPEKVWEMIDEDTKFMVASHISGTRSLEDTIAIFQKGFDQSKVRPKAVFVDGSHVYSNAFNNVFYTMRRIQDLS